VFCNFVRRVNALPSINGPRNRHHRFDMNTNALKSTKHDSLGPFGARLAFEDRRLL
jgi:hypothetical protein